MANSYFRENRALDSAFRHFAAYAGLKQLLLGGDGFYAGPIVSQEVVESVRKETKDSTSGGSGVGNGSGRSNFWTNNHTQDQIRRRRPPFAELADLTITLKSSAIAPLVALLRMSSSSSSPPLWPLSVFITYGHPHVAAPGLFAALAALAHTPLRVLIVRVAGSAPIRATEFRALRALTQLRVLELRQGMPRPSASSTSRPCCPAWVACTRLRWACVCRTSPRASCCALSARRARSCAGCGCRRRAVWRRRSLAQTRL